MKRMMMAIVLAVAGIAAADSDVDALKAVLEKVVDAETQYSLGNCCAGGAMGADPIVRFKKTCGRRRAMGSDPIVRLEC